MKLYETLEQQFKKEPNVVTNFAWTKEFYKIKN